MRRPWLALIAGLIVGTTLTIVGGDFSNEQGAPVTKPRGAGRHAGRRSQLAEPTGSYIPRKLPRSQRGDVRSSAHATDVRSARSTTVTAERGAVGGRTSGRAERRRPVPAQLSILPSGRRHGGTPGDQVRSRARAGVVARTGATAPPAGGESGHSLGGSCGGYSSADRPLPANSKRWAADAGARASAGSRHRRALRLLDAARRFSGCVTAVGTDCKLGSARRARRQGDLPHLP